MTVTDQKRQRATKMSRPERRQQLLDCAVCVFAEKGIDGARHADLAERAGVSVPATFTYFPNRETLVRAVLDEVRGFIAREVLEPFLAGGNLEDRMWQSGGALIELAQTHPGHVKVWIMWSAHFGEPYRSLSEDFEEETADLLCKLLLADREEETRAPVRELAYLIIGASRMLAQRALRQDKEEGIRHFMQTVANTVVSAIEG